MAVRWPWGQAPLWLESSALFLDGLVYPVLVCSSVIWPTPFCASLLCSQAPETSPVFQLSQQSTAFNLLERESVLSKLQGMLIWMEVLILGP